MDKKQTKNAQNASLWKRLLPDVVAVVLFAVLSFAYFYPADTEGRKLNQHDTAAGLGAGKETGEYMHSHDGEHPRWTNALFSGMPTYQMSPSYDSTSTLSTVEKVYHLGLPEYVWYLFVYLLGFYILLRAFDFRQYLAVLGSIFWAFSTYFLIIIAAGHIWKVMALAYLPPMIAGIVLAYRGKYLWGLLLTGLFAAMEIHANHVQMTYYYLFIILFMVIAFAVEVLREKRWKHLLKATGVCIAGGLLGVMVNLSNLYQTWDYSKATMRGGSELKAGDASGQSNASGLDRGYITEYSYGKGETWSLLIPNVQGGASAKADAGSPNGMASNLLIDTDAGKDVANQPITGKDGQPLYMQGSDGQPRAVYNSDLLSQLPQYWGDGFTMGPVYVGAFVIMLFVLALFVVKGPLKWALLGATVLSILLSWGRNYMGLTDWFIDHVPMYAKFRTVESILVIAEFTIPLLAMLGLKRIVEEPDCLRRKVNVTTLAGCLAGVLVLWGIGAASGGLVWTGFLLTVAVMVVSVLRYYNISVWKEPQLPVTPLILSVALTGGTLLLFALMPGSFFDFVSAQEKEMLASTGSFTHTLAGVRQSIFTSDCWRSLLIIAVGTVLLWLYMTRKLKALPMIGLLAVVCLFDLWQVNKRYLNDEMFGDMDLVQKYQIRDMTDADRAILADKSLDYRVLNLENFTENETSYYHKSIGGYHAAKLRRYQDLVDAYLIAPPSQASQPRERDNVLEALNASGGHLELAPGDQMWPVLNMLNAKYFLAASQNMQFKNPYAQGNAWFVDKLTYVGTADEELAGLGTVNLRHEAVADKQFQQVLGQAAAVDSAATVKLDSYEPIELKYTVDSKTGGVLVFSEIYYPGWKCVVDGTKEVELGRVNYVLRAMRVEPGHHTIELTFRPTSVKTTETIAYVALAILLAIVVLVVVTEVRRSRKQ